MIPTDFQPQSLKTTTLFIILWFRQTHRDNIIVLWFRPTHHHDISLCENRIDGSHTNRRSLTRLDATLFNTALIVISTDTSSWYNHRVISTDTSSWYPYCDFDMHIIISSRDSDRHIIMISPSCDFDDTSSWYHLEMNMNAQKKVPYLTWSYIRYKWELYSPQTTNVVAFFDIVANKKSHFQPSVKDAWKRR